MLGLRFCARAFSSCGKRGPPFIAVCRPLTVAASLVAEHRLQTHRLSSCDSRAQLLRGMWDLPRPGLEPVSPALAGRFSTTAPPGKTLKSLFLKAQQPLVFSLWYIYNKNKRGKDWVREIHRILNVLSPGFNSIQFFNKLSGTSLVAQWLRIRLPMQGTRVQSLVQEDPTFRRATKPASHNYWVRVPQLLSPRATTTEARAPRARAHNKRSHCNEKPAHRNEE